MYQVGTWQVDWSPAGPGNPPRLLLVRVDCLQLNWTHDHEHGLITATAISEVDGTAVRIDEDEPYGAVAFAPEQLVARVPAEWDGDHVGVLLAPLHEVHQIQLTPSWRNGTNHILYHSFHLPNASGASDFTATPPGCTRKSARPTHRALCPRDAPEATRGGHRGPAWRGRAWRAAGSPDASSRDASSRGAAPQRVPYRS